MKCEACKYERCYDLDTGEWIGDKEFYMTATKLFFEKENHSSPIYEDRYVYICPKCGTLKVNLNEESNICYPKTT